MSASVPGRSEQWRLAADCRYDLVMVSGVPGAGKTTAIALATRDLSLVDALDPEQVSGWLHRQLPTGLPWKRLYLRPALLAATGAP